MTDRPIPLDLVNGLTRRRFLTALGVGAVAIPVLSACGTSGTGGTGATTVPGTSTGSAAPAAGGKVVWSNWPLYLDAEDGKASSHPTLTAFEKESGLTVDYTEDINSNEEFFGKIAPMLQAGQPTGRDVVVLTDWMAARMIRLGYVEKLDQANIPNMKNLDPIYTDVPFDKGRVYSLPWQSGLTGIGYDPKKLGREIKTVDDMFKDDLKGRITMLTEMRDTMGLLLLSMGKDPLDHEMADYEAAIAKLQKLVDEKFIRQFTGNEYAADLASGNIGAAFAWSGDVVQLQADNPDITLQLPEEGAMLWSDNLMIPKGASNKAGAEKLMNYYYDPKVSAEVEAYVNYVCPIKGAQEAMQAIDKDLANNPLIFPDAETRKKLHAFKALDEATEKTYEDMFQKVIGA